MALYNQCDIVSVHFPFTDVSQTKRRPALVISNHLVNQTGDYLLVQLTSQVKQDGLSLPLLLTDYLSLPLPLVSFARVHKIFLLNESLIIKKITDVSPAFHQQLVIRINGLIG
jgi:mRNA interferase MazF